MNRIGWLACAMALLPGCTGDAEQGRDLAARHDSAGIEVVTNTSVDRALGWEFERVLALGGAVGGVEAFYGVWPVGLAFDGRGRIYVLDSGNRRVQVFDGSGAHFRTIGREGDGPGEFRYPDRLAVDPAGDIFVYDLSHGALIHFDTAGSYVGQTPVVGPIRGPMRVDGSRLVFAAQRRDPDTGTRTARIHRVASDDSTTLVAVPLPGIRQVYYASCGLGVPQAPLFADPFAWDARARWVAVAEAPHYAIRVFEDGVETRSLRRSRAAEPATRDLALRELGDGQEWHIPRDGECFVPAYEIIEAQGIADYVSILDRIAVSPDGSIWARRDVVGEDVGPIDVFDPSGRYLGTLPPSSPWPAAFGPDGTILVLEEDTLGVQRAVSYRVER